MKRLRAGRSTRQFDVGGGDLGGGEVRRCRIAYERPSAKGAGVPIAAFRVRIAAST